jgi:hypothetical protein
MIIILSRNGPTEIVYFGLIWPYQNAYHGIKPCRGFGSFLKYVLVCRYVLIYSHTLSQLKIVDYIIKSRS